MLAPVMLVVRIAAPAWGVRYDARMPDSTAPARPPAVGGRSAAPAELRLLQSFVNTNDALSRSEELTSAAALAEWLIANGLPVRRDAVTDGDTDYAIRVREAVRSFLSRDRGKPSDIEIALLDEVGKRARLQWEFDPDGGVHLAARSPGVPGALGTILSPLLSAALTGSLERLKTCRNCRWLFYDYSKNRSGTWCSMGMCGSRAKARRYYQRMKRAASERAAQPPA